MYIGLKTTHTTIPLVYPSRVTRHASLRSHRHMFIFHHPLPLGLVSLSPQSDPAGSDGLGQIVHGHLPSVPNDETDSATHQLAGTHGL